METPFGLTLRELVTYENMDEIQRRIRESLCQLPEDLTAQLLLCHTNEVKGNLRVAAEGYRHCLAMDDRLAFAHYRLGQCEYFLLNLTSCIMEMKRVQELESSYTMTDYWIGRSWANLLEYDKAIPHFERLLANYPDWTTVRMRLGETCERLGRLEEAQECFERVVRESPRCPIAHYQLGKLYVRQGQTMKAIEQFKEGLRQNPEADTLQKELEYLTSVDMP